MGSAVRKRLWQGLGANAYGTFVVAIVQLVGIQPDNLLFKPWRGSEDLTLIRPGIGWIEKI